MVKMVANPTGGTKFERASRRMRACTPWHSGQTGRKPSSTPPLTSAVARVDHPAGVRKHLVAGATGNYRTAARMNLRCGRPFGYGGGPSRRRDDPTKPEGVPC